MPVNNPINNFLVNRNIYLYYVICIKQLGISKISLVPIRLKSTPFNHVFFFISLIVKSFEILSKHSA